jgi:methionyl-tRNA formyltransferase
MALRLAFMGTPDFAVPTLNACLAAGHDIAAVYSQPPKPKGRGMLLAPQPIHAAALAHGLDVRTPKSLKTAEAQAEFAALGLDAAVVIAYGLILPQAILDAPKFGCFNVHGSLLPRWRGAAPIHRALEAGDTETGITIMAMDAGLDTGAMAMKRSLAIGPEDTTGSLHDALAQIGADLMVKALSALESGALTFDPQPADGVTYAAKITKDEARINWSDPAEIIARRIRAFNPYPGAFTTLPDGTRFKILAAKAAEKSHAAQPGRVLDDAMTIACGAAALRPVLVQREGKAAQEISAFLRGMPVQVGSLLGAS